MRLVYSLILCLGGSAGAQQVVEKQDGKGFDLVDSGKVGQAIEKGVNFLKSAAPPRTHHEITSHELVVYTLINAGVPDTDPVVQKYVAMMIEAPLERTYPVALQAMCLEEINRAKYQNRIWQCAQYLVDNQCTNGQWGYGQPTEAVNAVPTGSPKADVASGGGKAKEFNTTVPGDKTKPKVGRKIPVRKTKEGPAGGDNSNSQYAALGLRACHDSGIQLPEQVILLAKKWWYETQHANENKGKENNSVASGPDAQPGTPRGWCYQDNYGVCKGGPAYSTMTAGAVGAVVIYDYMQGREWKRNTVVKNGLAWLAANWSVTDVRGPSEVHEGAANAYWYYYLYALERVGMLYDTGKIGGHFWYPEGAKLLLEAQKPDGSWDASEPKQPVWDTCFAILFLKRATRPLVATGASK